MQTKRHECWLAAAFLVVLVAAALVYQPALKGPFLLDDFDNLGVLKHQVVDLQSLKSYLATGNAGPLGRPIAKLSFLLDDNAWPSSPDNFKRTNLYIHLLIGVVVFAAFRLMLRFRLTPSAADWSALFIAAFFLLHPLQVSTTMYVVQRMTQLASLFVMLGVALHVYWRTKFDAIGYRELIWMTSSLGVCGLLAILSKESGVLLPVFTLVAEATLLSNASQGQLFKRWKWLCLIVPTAGLMLYVAYWPRWLASYDNRDFSLSERLFTEPVVLLDYLRAIVTMKVTGLGLFHDDFPVYSDGLSLRPALSALTLVTALMLSVLYRKRYPVVCFGVLWFFAAHLLESTTIALELYFEHRNYVAMLGPVLAVGYLLYAGLRRVSPDVAQLAPLLAGLFLLIGSLSTWGYAKEWSSLDRIINIWAMEHRDSLRAQRSLAHLLAMNNKPSEALDVLDDTYRRFPHDLSLPVISQDIACFFDLPRRYTFEDLVHRVGEHKVTDGLRVAMTELSRNILKKSCVDEAEAVHKLLKALPNINKSGVPRGLEATFTFLDGELYLAQQQWMQALRAYLKVEAILPTVGSALRLSDFYTLLGDVKLAREFLLLSEKRNTRRRDFYYKYSDDQFKNKLRDLDRLEIEALRSNPK